MKHKRTARLPWCIIQLCKNVYVLQIKYTTKLIKLATVQKICLFIMELNVLIAKLTNILIHQQKNAPLVLKALSTT